MTKKTIPLNSKTRAKAKGAQEAPVQQTAASQRIENAFQELIDAVSGHGAMFVIVTAADTGGMFVAAAKKQTRTTATLIADALCRFRDEKQEGDTVSLSSSIYSSLIMSLAELASHHNPACRQNILTIHQDLSHAYVTICKEKGLELNERGEVVDKEDKTKEQEIIEPCKK